MKFWGGRTPPAWIREIANDRPRPLVLQSDSVRATPQSGDVVLKPFIDGQTYKQLFRVETWNTHDLLDGPFDDVRAAMSSAFEFGQTSRLAVWLDYSDSPAFHDLDPVPLHYCDHTNSNSESVA
jgi:hypothetical protein